MPPVRHCLQQIRHHILDYSAHHPEMPISYAVGYGLSTDLEGPTMRELFREADKNMYIDKNRAKMEEADVQHRTNLAMLNFVKKQGYHFSSCMYCDAQQDRYRALRAGAETFLAADGNYTGAAEQIAWQLCEASQRHALRDALQLANLQQVLKPDAPLVLEFQRKDEDTIPPRPSDPALYGECGRRQHAHFVLGHRIFP